MLFFDPPLDVAVDVAVGGANGAVAGDVVVADDVVAVAVFVYGVAGVDAFHSQGSFVRYRPLFLVVQ